MDVGDLDASAGWEARWGTDIDSSCAFDIISPSAGCILRSGLGVDLGDGLLPKRFCCILSR